LSPGFVGAYVVGGFVIYNISVFVPMGIGVTEGGWVTLLRMMGESEARVAAGLMMVLVRRSTLVLYAAVGLFMIAASSTVKRARERQAERARQGQEPKPTEPAPA
jgi:uncharacterized membrane protein YbhN (UPF0104 family)